MVYLVLLVILTIIIYGGVKVWDKLAVKKVLFKVDFDNTKVFAGEDVALLTEVVNKKILPLPVIIFEFTIPTELKIKGENKLEKNNIDKYIYRVVSSLLFYERLRREDLFTATKRGYYRIPNCKVTLGDFLGYSKVEMNQNIQKSITVYPRIKELNDILILPDSPQGETSVKRWILSDPLQVIGSRKYTSSDSFNTIDWKATAKLGELYVKKHDFTSEVAIMIVLDVQTSNIYWKDVIPEYIEDGIEIAGAIAMKALKEKIPVGYTANATFADEKNEVFLEPKINNKQESLILEALAKTSYNRTYPIERYLTINNSRLERYYTIVIITAYMSVEAKKKVNSLIREGYNVKIISVANNVDVNGIDKHIEIIKTVDNMKVEAESCINI